MVDYALLADRFGGEDRGPAVAVLISDGSVPLGRLSPTQGAALLQAAGVTLYSIALGGIDSVATERERGGLIFAPAELDLLEEIAVQTGGRLFRAVDAGSVEQALAWIENAHHADLPAPPVARSSQPLYPWPLGAALLLLAAWPWWAERTDAVIRL